jgi:DNA-binding beta-propeller fold protein YncE
MGTFRVGAFPQFVAFDGANIWVTDQGTNSISKLSACNGALIGTFAAGSLTTGIAFDGANVWAGNSGDGTLSKF